MKAYNKKLASTISKRNHKRLLRRRKSKSSKKEAAAAPFHGDVKYGDQCVYSDAELSVLVSEHGPFLMRFLETKLTSDQFDEVLKPACDRR